MERHYVETGHRLLLKRVNEIVTNKEDINPLFKVGSPERALYNLCESKFENSTSMNFMDALGCYDEILGDGTICNLLLIYIEEKGGN